MQFIKESGPFRTEGAVVKAKINYNCHQPRRWKSCFERQGDSNQLDEIICDIIFPQNNHVLISANDT